MTRIEKTVLTALTLIAAGCATVPASGPTAGAVLGEYDDTNSPAESVGSRKHSDVNYVLADINPGVLNLLKSQPPATLHSLFGNGHSVAQGTIRAGDHVSITVWESGPGALFSSSSTSSVALAQIPEQTVAGDGTVMVPYAGRVKVAGGTPAEAQARIQEKLHGTASQAQVLVTLTQSIADMVTLSGDGAKGGLIPLSGSGGRILDVIAQAGGLGGTVVSTTVQLVREGVSATVPLQSILRNPEENIRLYPGDTLIVSKTPDTFTALGATGKSAQVPFEADQVSLSEAMGRVGGLLDERANRGGVFVFRYERREVAAQLCSDCQLIDQPLIPVVFHLDMLQARSLFDAQGFQMANRDVLYVADASPVQLQKVLAIIRDFLSPVITGVVLDRAIVK